MQPPTAFAPLPAEPAGSASEYHSSDGCNQNGSRSNAASSSKISAGSEPSRVARSIARRWPSEQPSAARNSTSPACAPYACATSASSTPATLSAL
eukprot:3438246-Prymnesium_polylepis.2